MKFKGLLLMRWMVNVVGGGLTLSLLLAISTAIAQDLIQTPINTPVQSLTIINGKQELVKKDNDKTIFIFGNPLPNVFDVWEVHSSGEAKFIRKINIGKHDTSRWTSEAFQRLSPDESKIAYIKESNLWICDKYGNSDKQITIEGIAGDEQHFSTKVTIVGWSPDSTKLVYELSHDDSGEDGPELITRPFNYGLHIYSFTNSTDLPVTVKRFTGLDFQNNILYEKDPDSYFNEGKSYYPKPDQIHPVPWPATLQIMDQQGNSHVVCQLPDREQIAQAFISEDGHHAVVTTTKKIQSFKTDRESKILKVDLNNGQMMVVSKTRSFGEVWNPSLSPGNKKVAWDEHGLVVDNKLISIIKDNIEARKWIDDKTIACVTGTRKSLRELLIVDINDIKILGRFPLK